MRALVVSVWGALLASCAPLAPAVGDQVSDGVARALFEVRARHTDLVRVHVFFPADASGRPRGAGSGPGVVFLHGGFVGVERYAWQAEALAKAGYTAALPEHALDLAFFEIDNAVAAFELLRAGPPGSLLEGRVNPRAIAAAGHSLGGVVAVKAALAADAAAVVLEASYADSADAASVAGWSMPSLSLAGAEDCSAKLDQTRAGAAELPGPTAFVVLEGVTHYQFTDSDREDRQRGCAPTATLEDAHARIAQALLAFLPGALGGKGVDVAALEAVPGAEVSAR
jgi:pimeloyl-ACP methyl ester carboxylesterase